MSINLRKSVKSFYIINEIFSYLEEVKKLELIKYNKKYQNEFGINFEYYKNRANRYIEGGITGLVKEYKHDGKLIFEGHYLNGRRNGKGKIYHENGELKFEGKFRNGIIIEGKGYDIHGYNTFKSCYILFIFI